MALYVGIDVSKEKFDACGIGDEGKKLFSLSCSMNRDGFEKLVVQLTKMNAAALLLGMESTASYHIASVFLSYRKRLPRCHYQPSADRELRKTLFEKNED